MFEGAESMTTTSMKRCGGARVRSEINKGYGCFALSVSNG